MITRTCAFVVTCCLPMAQAQLLQPTGQERRVFAETSVSQGGNTVSDDALDQAQDFGTFDSTVNSAVDHAAGSASSGAWQLSFLTADSFRAEGNSSASSSAECGADSEAISDSLAALEFDVAVDVVYRVTGSYEGYDGGFASWNLWTDGGQWLDGDIGISKGLFAVNDAGFLPAGSYRIEFLADSYGGSSCGFGFAFTAFDLEFRVSESLANYCTTSPNSVGGGATLTALGSVDISQNDFTLRAFDAAPGQFGLYYYGSEASAQPFGDGVRCVGGATFRLGPPQTITQGGSITRLVDFTSGPAGSGAGQVLAYSTWYFQLWYRDPAGPGGTGFNLSDGIVATFLP